MNYVFYTALGGIPFGAANIKVAVALSKDLDTIQEKHLVTPFNAKGMCMFPEKIGGGKAAGKNGTASKGKLAAILTVNTDRKPPTSATPNSTGPRHLVAGVLEEMVRQPRRAQAPCASPARRPPRARRTALAD